MANSGRKATKKKLIIALIVIFSVLIVLGIIASVIPYLGASKDEEIIADFDFYPADYSEDIYADEEYTKLIKNGILKYDNGTNSVEVITTEDCKDNSEPYAVVCKMLYSIVDGDSEEYNSYFSEEYFKENPKKENFTPQKIYDANLKLFGVETIEDKNSTYNQYTFQLKYRIYKNNGTFRKDIGEGYRTQYFVVTDRNGTLLIDNIMYEKVK